MHVDELPNILKTLGIVVSPDVIEDVLRGSSFFSTLNWDEFQSFLIAYRNHEVGAFRRAFDAADHDNDGSLGLPELCNLLQSLGYPVTRQTAREILETCDHDKNGGLEFKEFERMLHYAR